MAGGPRREPSVEKGRTGGGMLPASLSVEFRGNGNERSSDQEQSQVDHNDGQEGEAQSWNPVPPGSDDDALLRGQLAQTGGTEHPIIVLRDALPAEKFPALGTPGRCLALGMIFATPLTESRNRGAGTHA